MSDSRYYMPPSSYRREEDDDRNTLEGGSTARSHSGVKRESTWRPPSAASKTGASQASSARPTSAWAARDSPRSSSPGPSSARRTDSYYEPPTAPRRAGAECRDVRDSRDWELDSDNGKSREWERRDDDSSRWQNDDEEEGRNVGEGYRRRPVEKRRPSPDVGGWARRRHVDERDESRQERGAPERPKESAWRDRDYLARERDLPLRDRGAPLRDREPPVAPRRQVQAQSIQRDRWRAPAQSPPRAERSPYDDRRATERSPVAFRRGDALRRSPDYGTGADTDNVSDRRRLSPRQSSPPRRRRSPTPDSKRRAPPSPEFPDPKRARDLSPPRRARSPSSDRDRWSSRSPTPPPRRRSPINGRSGRVRSPESPPRQAVQSKWKASERWQPRAARSPPRGPARSPARGLARSPARGPARSPSRGSARSPVRGSARSPPRGPARSPPRAPLRERARDERQGFRQSQPNHTAARVRMRQWGRPASRSPTPPRRQPSTPPRDSPSPRGRTAYRSLSRSPSRSPSRSSIRSPPRNGRSQWRPQDEPKRAYGPGSDRDTNGHDDWYGRERWQPKPTQPLSRSDRSPPRAQTYQQRWAERDRDVDEDRQPPVQPRARGRSPAQPSSPGRNVHLDRLADKERQYDQHLSTVAPYITAAFRQWYAQDATPALHEFLDHYFGRQPSRLELDQIEQLLSLRRQLSRDQDELRGLHSQSQKLEDQSSLFASRKPPTGPRAAQPPLGPRATPPAGPRSQRADDSRDESPGAPPYPPIAPRTAMVTHGALAEGGPPMPHGAMPLPPFPPPLSTERPPPSASQTSSSRPNTLEQFTPQDSPSGAPPTQSRASRHALGEAYERLAQVGEGTYGKVYKARNVETGALVALKRIRMEQEKDGFPITSMREIKLLQALRHPNVVRLSEMMVSKGSVYMVLEYMNHDLTGILSHPEVKLSPANIKSLNHQMLSGLGYLHKRGILHRDMKGSNILLNGAGELKLADFGLARWYHKHKRDDYTNRVITLWYRSPELLMGETCYGPEVDTWSAGCIMLEIFTTKPVFQGTDEINQLEAIYTIMGTPSEAEWSGLPELPWYELVRPRETMPSRFRSSFAKWLSPAAMSLAEGLLCFDPAKRLLADGALKMPYFTTEEPAMEPPTQLAACGEHHEMTVKMERHRRREAK